MAGYSKIYCVGEPGGFMGADGINPILFQILVGDADRQWYEVHYFDTHIKPIGKIEAMIPESPDSINSILDACLIFFPEFFESCKILSSLKSELSKCTRIDFNLKSNVPENWQALRNEAQDKFKELAIFEADLKRIQ